MSPASGFASSSSSSKGSSGDVLASASVSRLTTPSDVSSYNAAQVHGPHMKPAEVGDHNKPPSTTSPNPNPSPSSSPTTPPCDAPSHPSRSKASTNILTTTYSFATSFHLLTFALVITLLASSRSSSVHHNRRPQTSSVTPQTLPICENPPPFPTKPPTSSAHKMSLLQEAQKIADQFLYNDEDVKKGVKHFITQMNEGLEKNATTMSQIPTYVTAVPNGTEKGLYLAVDLGGTNFRVCSIDLHGDTTFSLTQSKVKIPNELMLAKTGKELFAFLAKQIESFLKTHHEDHFEAHVRRRQGASTPLGYEDEHIFRLGFTFSFPVHQIGINRGTLIRWTKGFDIADVVGQDVCALLQEQIDELRLPVKVAALVNDTVGTLMSRSYTSPGKTGTLLGAIFGTGTNGAYVEKLSKVTKPLDGDYDKSTGEMIVNTEWGSFDNELSVLPSTIYDEELDKMSVNPGIQMFEKRVSGMFLGEILRIVLTHMIKANHIDFCRDANSNTNDFKTTTNIADDSPLYKQWAVDSSILSIAEADNSFGYRVLRQEMEKSLKIHAASAEDAQAIKIIAGAIGKRAARLAGVAIAAVVLQTNRLEKAATDESPHKGGEGIKTTGAILEDLKSLNITAAVTATATKLVDAAGLSQVLNPDSNAGVAEDDIVDVGVDGSLVEFYPGFEDEIRGALRAADGVGIPGERRIRIGIAKDGSGVGAALIALVAAQQEKKNTKTGGDYLSVY